MDIYLDVFLIENLIVNFFLLSITCKVLRLKSSRVFQFLGAALGTLYGLLVLILGESINLNNIFIKLFVSVLMCILATKRTKLISIIKSTVVFMFLTIFLAGLCIFIEFSKNDIDIAENVLLINFSYKKLMLGLMIAYIVFDRIFEFIKGKIEISELVYDVNIITDKGNKKVSAFLDTGNGLKEPVTNLPVIIVEEEYINDFHMAAENIFNIPYKVVNGQNNCLKGFKPTRVDIYHNNNKMYSKDVIIAVTNSKLSEGEEFNALLSRGIIE